jgi:hypothetical protein
MRRFVVTDGATCELALKDLRGAIRSNLAAAQRPDCFYHIGLVCDPTCMNYGMSVDYLAFHVFTRT